MATLSTEKALAQMRVLGRLFGSAAEGMELLEGFPDLQREVDTRKKIQKAVEQIGKLCAEHQSSAQQFLSNPDFLAIVHAAPASVALRELDNGQESTVILYQGEVPIAGGPNTLQSIADAVLPLLEALSVGSDVASARRRFGLLSRIAAFHSEALQYLAGISEAMGNAFRHQSAADAAQSLMADVLQLFNARSDPAAKGGTN